jgi:exosortase
MKPTAQAAGRRPQSDAADAAGAASGAGAVLGALALLAGCLVWSYWPTLRELVEFWRRSEDYSVGALVPLVAIGLAARDWAALRRLPVQPCLWGLLVLAGAEGLRLGGEFFGVGSGPRYGIVVAVVGVVLLAGGPAFVWRLRWIFVFLLLMVPWPARVHEAVALPLQLAATHGTVFGLELLGFFVVREGHVIRLEDQTSVAVTEACSGLRMLTAFIFVAAVLAFLSDRPRWQRAALLLGSVPIAVLSNALRGVATAMFMFYVRDERLGELFHDGAGLAMMPLALLMSWGLMALMKWTSDCGDGRTPDATAARVPARRTASPRGRHA